jgi:FlaA1/EpsC-like NDP-sugar epimerase
MPENSAPPYTLATSTSLEVMRLRRSYKSDERRMLGVFVAFVGVRLEERVIEVSRGSGRLMRRVLQVLETTPERRLDRVELERVLVEGEGFDSSNLLRSIRALSRRRLVGFVDRPSKRDSLVSLPREVQRITDDEIFALLAEIEDKGGRK